MICKLYDSIFPVRMGHASRVSSKRSYDNRKKLGSLMTCPGHRCVRSQSGLVVIDITIVIEEVSVADMAAVGRVSIEMVAFGAGIDIVVKFRIGGVAVGAGVLVDVVGMVAVIADEVVV